MKPTIAMLAELCGVSPGTVDRVVHNRPHVNPETREKVMRAVEQTGYELPKRSGRAAGRQVKVAILLPKWTDAHFIRQIYAGINLAEHAINDPDFKIITRPLTSRTTAELLRAMDEVAAQGVNGMIVNPPDDPLIRARIDSAVSAGIKVVTYDSDVPKTRRTCFIGQNLNQAGRLAAGLLARFLGANDEVLVIAGNMDYESHRGRVNGFLSELIALGHWSYILEECQERFDLTSQKVFEVLSERPRVSCIYMANESVAGCMDGIRRAKPQHMPRIVCNDLTPSAKKYLQNRQIDFVIDQPFSQKALLAVRVMHQLLCTHREPDSETLFTETQIITTEML